MCSKYVRLLLLGLTIAGVAPIFATIEQELNEALAAKSYLFPGELSAVERSRDGRDWTFQSDGATFLIKKGRPDAIGGEWKRFVAKLTLGENAKIALGEGHLVIDHDADYTVFRGPLGHEVTRLKPLTALQQDLLTAVRNANFIEIERQLEGKDTRPFRSREFIHHLLNAIWDRDYNVKMAASYVLGLLSKDQKLGAYVYRVWSEAADEMNYRYRTKPIYSGSCQSAIRQYGIYDVSGGGKKGFVVATRMPHDNEGADALYRKTMDEDFFIISGRGEFWTKDAEVEHEPFVATAGDFISNPAHMHIQFRNIGDTPLKMIVTTNPPFDHVIKKFPDDVDKEIHRAIGPWEFDDTVNKIAHEIHELGLRDKNKVREILVDPAAQYVKRLYAAKLFEHDFIEEKLAIANNETENWALRVAVIKSLQGNKTPEVFANLRNLRPRTSGFVKKAIDQVLK